MKTKQITLVISSSLIAAMGFAAGAFAQSGDSFFGSSVPSGASSGNSSIDRPPGVAAAEQQALKAQGGANDFTSDEKRMQKKYKANMRAADDNIAKADRMIKDGQKKKDEKMVKKGKVLKEIAEKTLKELKENNPIPDNK